MNSTNALLPTHNILFPNKLRQSAFGATADTPLLGATAPNPFDAVAAAPPGSFSANTPGLLGAGPGLLGDAASDAADVASGYSSSELLERSIDIYGGLEYLTLVMFSIVQNYDNLLKKISVDLNTNRRGYNELMAASEKVKASLTKLREVSSKAGAEKKFLNPTTNVEYFKAVPKGQGTPVSTEDAVEYWKYPDADTACDDATPGECVLTNDDLDGIITVITILDPARKGLTKTMLKTSRPKGRPLSMSKIKEIYDDAQQRLVYMNAVSVQKGGLIQAAETNYQIVVQFSAGIIAVIKTVGGAIAQRL